MSGTRGAGGGNKAVNGKGNNGPSSGAMGSIPQATKKMLQSLKEIVNCPETEIYAMLKECNMDPNETVNRLLSQDPFHQVKSKKEKKKENKDATGLRSHSTGGAANRGTRGGNDRYSLAILSQFSPSETVGLPAKPSYRKDDWNTNTSSSSPGVVGNSMNWMPPAVSEASVEGKSLTVNNSEGISSLQQASGFHSPWSGVPGKVSMADIVKMGRPHVRGSSNATRSHQIPAHHHVAESQFAPTPQELYSSQNHVNKATIGLGGSPDVPEIDEWPQDDQPEPQVTYETPSRQPFDRTNYHLDEVQLLQCAVDAGPGSVIPSKVQDECSGSVRILNDELHDSTNSYEVQQPTYGHREVEDTGVSVSSVLKNVLELSLSKEEEEGENSIQEREIPVVKIPDHLQIRSSDCSHLSFGSFGSVMTAPSKCDVEDTSTAAHAQSLEHTDSRNSYENDEHVRTATATGVINGTYDMPSASQPEVLKQGASEVIVAHGNDHSFPSSSPNYTFENGQHLNPLLTHTQLSSQIQNLAPLSGIMSYPNSTPSNMLPSNNVQTDRDAQRSYSPFPASTPNSVPSGTMTEALKTGNLSSPHLSQNIPVSNISEGPAFPQQLPVHPYSQPSVPFANMMNYPFLAQSYAYMPPAFQQPISATSNSSYHAFQQAIAAAGNSAYHQSISAGVLPHYKNSVSANILPQSAATVPSGYGVFGNSTTNPAANSVNYEDVLRSQYKDTAHLLPLHQGGGSRTVAGVPGSAYYSLQEQSHQAGGYSRQSQQPSQAQQYGYPANFYHSQTGVPLDGSLVGPHGQPQAKQQQQQQQMWQNSY